MKTSKVLVLILILTLALGGVPKVNNPGIVHATVVTYTRTYTQMLDYNYGEKNEGFYLAPDKPGKYPVIFMFHGASEKSSSNVEYRSHLMDTVNKWIALGYMDPMVIIVPNIEREDASDDWSCYGFYYYVSKGRFGSLLKKIKNGECEFDDKVDHDSKFSVTGFSMGGVESLFIGTSYKNDILNIGACSPSYMYYHVTGDNDDGWIKKPDVNFTNDPNAHLFMGYGAYETDFRKSVERYDAVYKQNKTAEQKDFVIYGSYPGGHEWSTFSREIFYFIYYMKFDETPDAATIEKACKDTYLDYGDDASSGGKGGKQDGTSDDSSQGDGNGNESGSGGADSDKKEAESWKKNDSGGWYYVNSDGEKASNEWIDGYWLGDDGILSYTPTGSWKQNETGWWYEDTSGWYPVNQWQKIDGKWYYFTESGYMDYSGYREGYWLGADGALIGGYEGKWKKNSTGWWFEDISGWWPSSTWLKIDGYWYYFDASGYMV